MRERIRERSGALKREAMAVIYAYRDPRLGLWPKIILWLAAACLASPIDLIPDCIPVLGLLDDLVVLAGAVWLARRMVPDDIMEEARERARTAPAADGRMRLAGAAGILLVYLLIGLLAYRFFC